VADALDPMGLRQSANQSTEHQQPPFVVRMEPPFVVPMEGLQSSVDHTEYRGSGSASIEAGYSLKTSQAAGSAVRVPAGANGVAGG
jgi:hypothetical protein